MNADTVPRVSVVVPCYNYERYLDACIRSALDQEGVTVDITIIDDASTDTSPELARRWSESDDRVRLVEHTSNKGHIHTFNEALQSATAPFLVKLDPDDLLTPGSLRRSASVLTAHPEVAFVYGTALVFEGEVPRLTTPTAYTRRVWSGEEWIARIARHARNPIFQPEIMIRADTLTAVGGHNAEVPAASDFNLWLRLAARGGVARIDGPVQGLYRVHPQSMQRTIHSGRLEDLRSRSRAFELFFEDSGKHLQAPQELRRTVARTLAKDARELAFEELDSGTDPRPLMEEGRALDPGITGTIAWRSLERQAHAGGAGVWWSSAGRLFRQLRWRARWWTRWSTQRWRGVRAWSANALGNRG